jgi:hypothetical protein
MDLGRNLLVATNVAEALEDPAGLSPVKVPPAEQAGISEAQRNRFKSALEALRDLRAARAAADPDLDS